MYLYINTTPKDRTVVELREKGKLVSRKNIKTEFNQAEKLLKGIDQILQKKKIRGEKLEKTVVKSRGGSFTSLRIGVVTANALAYGWGIPVEPEVGSGKVLENRGVRVVKPNYSSEPNITTKK